MLEIKTPASEQWDEEKGEFVYTQPQVLQLEHSLISLSKWEAKWHKAFLEQKEISNAEFLDYIRCMTINKVKDSNVYSALTAQQVIEIREYIDSPMSATVIQERIQEGKGKGGAVDKITSELIYYWLIAFKIPFDCQKWHLNRLLKLIQICELKNNSSPKKRSMREIMQQNKIINEERKRQFKTKG